MASLRSFIQKRLEVEADYNAMTPAQWKQSVKSQPLASAFNRFRDIALDRQSAPYNLEKLDDNLHLFRHQERIADRTIVCFTGKWGSLFMPIPAFLQLIGGFGANVLVVHDPERRSHLRGIPGRTASLLETCAWIDNVIGAPDRANLFTFGTSMGGFSAVRAGHMLGAARAISIGGRMTDHQFVLTTNRVPVPPDDGVCVCRGDTNVQKHIYFSANCYPDRQGAEQMKAIWPDTHLMNCQSRKHNVLEPLAGLHKHKQVFEAMFSSEKPVDINQFY